ncbi:cytochrome c peroxidase [Flavobacterium sp. NG2]|uniref:cytochrome-c peroxidase n=1 Tax=Flavobacterium sp. NG2 TaxID=3097547 RepID=UPI002A841D17|nr:cytochrome c peroxidase [Flavobacterium sp. NG2]WPR70640.1 cytochrome c peroxidase [Flavobacterium sp. NG2]
MRLFKNMYFQKVVFVLKLSLLMVFLGCEKEYKELTIQEELVLNIDKINEKCVDFQTLVDKTDDDVKIQQAFDSTRIGYKKIEWAVEYFTPNSARFINGPALDELEVAENTFISPNGFQVMEELIYPNYSSENKETLIREIKVLIGNLKQVQQHLAAITISNSHVLDASKMELIRIMSLGITGFDSPIALRSIPEAKSSLESLKSLILKMNFNTPASDQCENKIVDLIDKAAKYCDANTDFNTFDRAYFIKNFINPISVKLVSFQKINKIESTTKNSVVNPSASTIFDKKAFNVNAFIPSEEYRFSEEKAVLGEKLFYENSFSNDQKRNCASCHIPSKGFTDGLKTNQSLKGGFLSRNTPMLTYASLQNAQFWDLRQLDLEKQSLDVIQNKEEMHGNVANAIQVLNKDQEYIRLFKKAFPKSKKIEEWQVQNALASYIRSLNAFDSKFDEYMRGDSDDFSEEEKLGFNVFAGKAKCATCHFIPLFNGTVPPTYQKTEHEVIGTPDDKKGTKISPDMGRYLQYQMPQLKHTFKTPSLRNVAITAPYMHNGLYTTLEEVIEFYNNGGGVGLGLIIENQTLASDKLELTDKEIKALVAFMKTLTDKTYQ